MTDVDRWLNEQDPLNWEPELPDAEAEALRRSILKAAASTAPSRKSARQLVLAAGAITVFVVALVLTWVGHQLSVALPHATVRTVQSTLQLQFSAPGGRRILWTFNPGVRL